MKTCTKCKQLKDLSHFNKRLNRPCHYSSWCKECSKSVNDDYRKIHREDAKRRTKKYIENNPEKHAIHNYTMFDKKKGFICNLTVDWYRVNITGQSCTYCGTKENIGCDRIDNTKGHTQSNCIPCCSNCNYIRGDRFTVEEMLIIGKAMREVYDRRNNV